MSTKDWIRDSVARAAYRLGVTRPRRVLSDRLTIVTFHRVLPVDARREYPIPELVVTPEELAWFVEFFQAHFSCGPLRRMARDWLAGTKTSKPALAITFDDGQLDNFMYARPVLANADIRATFFVPVIAVETHEALWHDRLSWAVHADLDAVSELVRRRYKVDVGHHIGLAVRRVLALAKSLPNAERRALVDATEQAVNRPVRRPHWDRMMSWDDVRALHREGHEIGSHSMTHPILTQCSLDEITYEIGASRTRLEEVIGDDVTSFCYPNGDHDPRVLEIVSACGYELGVTTRWGTNRKHAPALALDRCDIQGVTARARDGVLSGARLALRLSGLQPGLRGS